jgi:hypothetical protein
MVVIDQRDSTHNNRIWSRGSITHQPLANQIAKGFRTVGIPMLAHPLVKLLEKVRIQRHANSIENAHSNSFNQ